jgi:4-amino-4-deoxy-L-arabinose transferase-like glycosyltransferase
VLFTFLYLLALIAIALLPERPARERLAWVAGVGLLVAASAYVREAGLSLVPIALLYWGWSFRSWRRGLGWAGAAALLAGLLIAPWTARNVAQLDGFVGFSSSTGANFWGGHHEGATGGFPSFGLLLARSKPRTEPGGEADINQRGMRDGLKFLIRHPLTEAGLVRQKLRFLYQGDTIGLDIAEAGRRQPFIGSRLRGALERLADGIYYAVLALAGLAMVRWAVQRDRQPLLPAIAIACLTLGYVAFWGDPRFHFPIVPLFCLLAGWALAGLWHARSQLLHTGH